MKLILVRHGESIGNQENRLQGQHDYELTAQGERQAILTADRLADEGVTALYTSPLLRASATASAIGSVLGITPEVMEDVIEYHFGDLSGHTFAELRQHFTGATQLSAAPSLNERIYPGEEGRDKFYRRVTEALWALVARHPADVVAVVSHGGPIALFCQSVLGLPYKRPMPFNIDNCSLNVIEFPEGRDLSDAVLQTLNDCCHLKPLGRRNDQSRV